MTETTPKTTPETKAEPNQPVSSALPSPVWVGALIDGVLHAPMLSLCPPERLAALLKDAALAYLPSPLAAQHAEKGVAFLHDRLSSEKTVRACVPPVFVRFAKQELVQPYFLQSRTLSALLRRPAVARLFRELTRNALLDFAKKLRTQVSEVSQTRGGMLGRLASEAVKKSGSAISALAPGMTQAVSDELSRQMTQRATELADQQVQELSDKLCTLLTDPARKHEQRELLSEVLDFALDQKLVFLRDELFRHDPVGQAARFREAVVSWLAEPDTLSDLSRTFASFSALLEGQTLATLLGPALPLVKDFLLSLFSAPR